MANQWRGPAPARAGDGAAPLTVQRAAVLEVLQTQDAAVTAARVAELLALHVNTAREHLDALVERGLAVRRRAPAAGRGRPAWTYAAAQLTEHDPRVREYAGLASALAGHLARTSTDPHADAVAAGHAWGTDLVHPPSGEAPGEDVAADRTPGEDVAADRTASGDRDRTGRERVHDLLRELGFDPHADPEVRSVALRRCPLLDAARRYPEVICGVHLGVVRGALEGLGASETGAELQPFGGEDSCLLTLPPA